MRLVIATVWLLIGTAISGAVYWGFLTTPESTIWTLLASATLAVIVLGSSSLTLTGAIAIVANGLSGTTLVRAVRATPVIVPALLIVMLVWWVTTSAETWVALRSGQIDAWFIARFGWADMSWLFRSIRYAALWLRWVVALVLALSLMAAVVLAGTRATTQVTWLRRALHPRTLLVATVLFGVLIALPWRYLVPWRPEGLPPTSVELVFIVAKLSITAVMFASAVTLIIRETSGSVPPRLDPEPHLPT